MDRKKGRKKYKDFMKLLYYLYKNNYVCLYESRDESTMSQLVLFFPYHGDIIFPFLLYLQTYFPLLNKSSILLLFLLAAIITYIL